MHVDCVLTYIRAQHTTHNTGTGPALGNSLLYCRYYRLPLPVEGAPLEEDFDAFVNILRVSSYKNVTHGNSPPFRWTFFGCALPDALLLFDVPLKLLTAGILERIWTFSLR